MAKPTLDDQRKALQDKRKAMRAGIEELDKQIEYFDNRLANYRQGSKDIQSSISRLKNDFGRSFARHNIQNPEVKRQALLSAIEERKRIIEYQTNAHDFSANSPAVEAVLVKQKFDKNPSPAKAGVSINGDEDTQYTLEDDAEEAAVEEEEEDEAAADVEDEDEEEAAVEEGNEDEDEDVEDAASIQDTDEDAFSQTASTTESTKPKTHSELLNDRAKESHTRQLAKMDELLDAVKNMDFSKKPDSEVFQAFVDSEIEQQELMLDHFEDTIKEEETEHFFLDDDWPVRQGKALKAELHDEYDEILLKLRDENLKVADSLCQKHNAIDHEDWPEVTKPWLLGRVYGSKDYREYSTDRNPANVIQYFSRLASTGMFNGMEFGEKSMSIDAKPTLKIKDGKLELVEPADPKLKAAFNDQYSNGTKTHHRRFNDIELQSFQDADAENPDRNAKYKQAATERLKAKIQSLQKRQDALATKATDLQEKLEDIEKFEDSKQTTTEKFQTSKKTTTAGYQRPKSTGSLGKLKDDLAELKACKQGLDAVKSFPMFSNKDLGKRAAAQKDQIEKAEKFLQAQAANPLTPTTAALYVNFQTAQRKKDKTEITKAKDALAKRCQDTLTALDENISKTEAKIKPLQAKYFEYQKLQKECAQEQGQTAEELHSEIREYRKEQINTIIDTQLQESNIPYKTTPDVIFNKSSGISHIPENDMAYVSVYTTELVDPTPQQEAAAAKFYVDLAKKLAVGKPTLLPLQIDSVRPMSNAPYPVQEHFLTIAADGKITFPQGAKCSKSLQGKINTLQQPTATAAATTAPPTSAPPPPNIAAINGNADMQAARWNDGGFVRQYNMDNPNANLTVNYYGRSNSSQFTLSAGDADTLKAGLFATLQHLSQQHPEQTFVGKIGNETFTYTGGQLTSTADTSLHSPLSPENDGGDGPGGEEPEGDEEEDVLSELDDHSPPATAPTPLQSTTLSAQAPSVSSPLSLERGMPSPPPMPPLNQSSLNVLKNRTPPPPPPSYQSREPLQQKGTTPQASPKLQTTPGNSREQTARSELNNLRADAARKQPLDEQPPLPPTDSQNKGM